MRKYNGLMIMVILLQLVGLNPVNFNAATTKNTSDCFSYQLSVDKSTVQSGKQVKISLSYESLSPVCSASQIKDEKIDIDFSKLASNEGISIDASFDTEIFNIEITDDGHAIVTYHEWDEIHNSLETVSGDIVFTVSVDNDISGPISVTDNLGDEVIVNVQPNEIKNNTAKWSHTSYAAVGDIIDYSVRINTDHNEVTNFSGIDNPSAGLSYIDDSFYVTNQSGSIVDSPMFTADTSSGQLIITNTAPFDDMYYLHYQMQVTSEQVEYHNDFTATYDGVSDQTRYTIKYDTGGDSNIIFSNGQIKINKINEQGTELPGATFDILNSENVVVDTVTTDETGNALSDNLALGEYTVIETEAPAGYVLDDTRHSVTISENGQVATIEIENVEAQTPDITLPEITPTGQIEITKVDEDDQLLMGAEFDIIDSNNNIVDHIITATDGKATSKQLELGEYTIIETKAPDGYVLDETPILTSISTVNQLVEVAVVNKPIIIDQVTSEEDSVSETEQDVDSASETKQDVDSVTSERTKQQLAVTGSNSILIISILIIFCGVLIIIQRLK